MPLQNRVLPDGEIVSAPWRGTFMGNRGGRIHDPVNQTLSRRRWASRRWIICRTGFKNRQRKIMGNGYTELFFLDEVCALAAGHRPCFECQRARANQFAAIWETCHGAIYGSKADGIDLLLHEERTQHAPSLFIPGEERLPDGAIFQQGERFFAVRCGKVLEWSGEGYAPTSLPDGECRLLTPRSILAVLKRGYMPIWHGSCPAAEA